MKADQIREVETVINTEILKNTICDISIKDYKDAKKDGAIAMFGEKYDDTVRVLTIGDFSMELCGGTHCGRTGDIGLFKITEETSLASGVRRIVALTGPGAVQWVQTQSRILSDLQAELKCSADELSERIAQMKSQRKELEKKLKQKMSSPNFDPAKLVEKGTEHNGAAVVVSDVNADGMNALKSCGDALLAALKSGVGVLGSSQGEKPGLVVVVTPDLIEKGMDASKLAKSIGLVMGGGGGGNARMATAGGKDKKLLKKALKESESIIKEALSSEDEK
jgi:alanyl-tRNA synthetase